MHKEREGRSSSPTKRRNIIHIYAASFSFFFPIPKFFNVNELTLDVFTLSLILFLSPSFTLSLSLPLCTDSVSSGGKMPFRPLIFANDLSFGRCWVAWGFTSLADEEILDEVELGVSGRSIISAPSIEREVSAARGTVTDAGEEAVVSSPSGGVAGEGDAVSSLAGVDLDIKRTLVVGEDTSVGDLGESPLGKVFLGLGLALVLVGENVLTVGDTKSTVSFLGFAEVGVVDFFGGLVGDFKEVV
jgi:hypothetical protein